MRHGDTWIASDFSWTLDYIALVIFGMHTIINIQSTPERVKGPRDRAKRCIAPYIRQSR